MNGEITLRKAETVPIKQGNDVVLVRQRVRAFATEIGFSLVDQTKVVTAASELGRNTLEHGLGGSVEIAILDSRGRVGIRMTFEDQGPGIADLSLAMTDGYTSANGLGLGLSGSKRLMTDFELRSTVGVGTTVVVSRWK